MSGKKIIFKIIALAVILVLVLNPQWNIFMGEEARMAVKAEMQHNFGVLAGGISEGMLSLGKILSVIAVISIMWLLTIVICAVLDKVTTGRRRSRTVAGLLESVVKVLSVIFTFVWVLDLLSVNLAGIFASLGIASLIIGFGAQSLIEDTITGIFIILEGQYNVGDIIVVDDFRGTVEKINMRTTTIRDASNNFKIINNSDIRNIQNRSKELSVVISDIGMSYDEDLSKVEKIIINALPEIYEKNKDVFAATPEYCGVQELAASSVNLRVSADVTEANYFVAKRRLNRELKILFDENNIEIPFNQLVVHNAK